MKTAIAVGLLTTVSAFAGTIFNAGDIVVSVEGAGLTGGTYTDNQAAPLSLFQFTTAGAFVNSLVLPQTASGVNFAVSGEYGSSSEGTLQLSGNGQYLTIGGYGVNAAAFNANPGSFSPNPANTALGQSGSLLGQSYTAVPRVAALIDASGNVDSSTAVYGIFNANNPRSVYTADGTNIYLSGQGTSGDSTGGVFYTTRGSTSATPITGNDAGGGAAQDTRDVQIVNGQLYVSVDSNDGANNRDYIGSLGTAGNPPTSLANNGNGPALAVGTTSTGKVTITAATTNGINSTSGANSKINLSPESYFFANSTTVYIADSGDPKNNSNTPTGKGTSIGDGGLQKWTFNGTSWVLDYTLAGGLNLVANTNTDGTSGLYGLTGEVIGGQVELFVTNYTLSDLDPTFLYGITDQLSATTNPGEEFTELAAAPADSNFKGVSFAPTSVAPTAPEPASFALLGIGIAALLMKRRA